MRYRLLICILAVSAFLAGGPALAQERETLRIVTQAGATHEFDVEIADTAEERQVGLMFREFLDPYHGMLFDYRRDRRVSMWMKNTLIPLDMLFIERDGTIESIRMRTTPHSLESISSKGRVRGVLELAGGTADRLNIRPGDKIEHPIFD